MTRLFRTANLGIGATGRIVQCRLQSRAQTLHGLAIGVGWNHNHFAPNHYSSPEWHIDSGAIPIVEADETAGRNCKRHDRPAGFPRQHDDAEARDTRALRHVRGQCDIIFLFKRAHHFLERTDAALAMKRRAVIAGTANGADPQPFGGKRIEFTVAVPRDQRLGGMDFLGLDERRHKMLAMPECQDRRSLRFDDVIDVGWIEAKFIGQPHQPQELGRDKTRSALHPGAAQRIAKQLFQRAGFAS
jgi:hypothetical protein